jgi:nucleotide-binding universal stress UspA family protein
MELVVLNIGLDLGVISPTLFTMMVLMALVTTFMTSPLLEWVYPMAELEKQLLDPGEAIITAIPQAKPAFTVLACVSYERSGPGMIALAGALGDPPARGGRLYALRLVRPADRASFVLDQHQGSPPSDAEGLAPLLERSRELGLEVRALSFVSPKPPEDICSVAAVKRADLVLLGWHKPLLGKAVLGGTVHEVMRRAPAEVGVFVDRGLSRIERVLVPYLGSEHDRAALALSRRLASNVGAKVTILHVTRPTEKRLGVEEKVREVFHEEGRNGPSEVTFQVVEHESPVTAALEESARGYDLVIVGVGPEWGLEHRPFGMQSEVLISGCPTSLLVVRKRLPAAEAPVVIKPARAPFDTVPEQS